MLQSQSGQHAEEVLERMADAYYEIDDRLEARVATQNGPSPWTTVSAAA